ncbi:MAG TPA: hypothetical protein VNB24_00155 [Acidimicrobiales bacterium]|nr:hypothetical protein [Acidimicrobiales bacterium]
MTARRTLAACLASALLLAGCGGGDDKKTDQAGGDVRGSTTTSADETSEVAEGEGSTLTTAPGATTKKPPGASGPPTTAKGGGPTGSPSEPDVVAVSPGTYKFTSTGTSSAKGTANGAPINSSKKVDRAWEVTYQKPSGNQQRATSSGQGPFLERILSHGAGAADVTLLKLNDGSNPTTFTPEPPARFVPVPAAIDATWSWTMKSKPHPQNGKVTTRKGNFRVARNDVLMIDGQAVPVVVITGTMTSDQPLVRTYQFTTYYSESLKLVVREREITDADVQGDNTKIHVHTDQTMSIVKLTPA